MRRREFVVGFCASTAWSFAARAEQAKTYRVGLLASRPISDAEERRRAIKDVLAAHGFIEGRNLQFEARWGDSLAENVEALKAAKVDVIITFGYPAALVAKTSAKELSIVSSGADPVATGLAQSLARPGGNLTGVTELATELSAKRLEILKEAVPNLKKVAMLFNAADLAMTLRSHAAEAAAKVLNVSVQTFGIREPSDFGDAFAEMTRSPPDAMLMVSDTLTLLHRKQVMEFASNNRVPAMYEYAFLARDGGLMSYGPNLPETGRRVGDLVVRVLLGARAADLPLELPTHFEFVLNLKSAKSIGLDFPPALLSRADEVIE